MDSFFFSCSLCPYLIPARFYPSRIKGLGKEGEKRGAGKLFLGWDSWHLSRTGKCIKSALSLLFSHILGQPSCWAFNIGKCHSFVHLFPIQTWFPEVISKLPASVGVPICPPPTPQLSSGAGLIGAAGWFSPVHLPCSP